jgi:hypothetical protein
MTLKSVLVQGLAVLALGVSLSLLAVPSASAIPYDYTVTGTVTGTFNADLSVVGGSFNSWTLTTPTETFTNLTGTTLYNDNFTLLQLLGLNTITFIILPPPASDDYVGAYSGKGAAGVFAGSFVRAGAVPEPSTLLLLGSALVGLAVWRRTQLA